MARWLAFLLLAVLAACTGKPEAKVDGAVLARADGVTEAPDAPTVAVKGGEQWKLPDGDIVRVAVDRDVLFGEVVDVLQWANANPDKKRIALLVKDRRERIKAMEMPALPAEPRIRVVVTEDGKACVSLPGVDEAKCVKSKQDRVDRSYVRELVREAYKASNITRVGVEIVRDLRWGDAVRAVDGARTCCQGTTMTVGISTY